MHSNALKAALFGLAALCCGTAAAAGGPLGIDHEIGYDDSGIWKRSNQTLLQYGLIGGEVAGALWFGADDRLGKTSWQSIDATIASVVAAQGLKFAFSRSRPSQGNNPDDFFSGGGHQSFPSGEVALTAAVITPFVLEYGDEHPAAYLLEVLPAYDAVARMKVHAHWQTDVIAGFALGTLVGWGAHELKSPLSLEVLPHGVGIGLHKQFW